MQTDQLSGQIIDLSGSRKDGRTSRELGIKKDIDLIEGLIEKWKQTYLITAPISGKVSFSNIWNEQQFISTNQEALTIVPEAGVGQLTAKAILPVENSGKVMSGQKVNIRLDGYPYQEFGIIESSLKSISLVPMTFDSDNPKSYILEIGLPDSLVTTYNKTIPFRQEMQGVANIITEDRRVLERIFDRGNNILKN